MRKQATSYLRRPTTWYNII